MEVVMAAKKAPVDLERGARLATHRKRLGLTQPQVAERIGVVKEVVSRHERGLGMDADTLVRYAQLYGVTADSIVGSNASLTQSTPSKPSVGSEQHPALLRFLNDGRCNPLTDKELQHMIRHIAAGESQDLDDLEIHLLGYRYERDRTDESLSKLRASVKRAFKASGQVTLDATPEPLPVGKRKKLARRSQIRQL